MGFIELPGWATGNCLFGIGHQCLIKSDLRSFAQHLRVNLKLADPTCATYHFGICFQKASSVPAAPIFNFAVFVTALTLLAVVFTISDTRFKFRIAIAPGPFRLFSTIYLVACGIAVLLSDLAFNQGWQIPRAVNSDAYWQAFAGGAFLLLVIVWITIGFLRPPKFGRLNALKYGQELYRVILTGNNAEITAIAHELVRSAQSIIKYSPQADRTYRRLTPRSAPKSPKWIVDRVRIIARAMLGTERLTRWSWHMPWAIQQHAWSILLLMGDRRFCAAVAAGAPRTAIAFFQEMGKQRKLDIPIHQFSVNISQEAILNNQSLLYQEDDGWRSGALGYWKPFSAAVYGNYELVETLASLFGSPLDVSYPVRRDWTAEQFAAFIRVVLVTFGAYLKANAWGTHSYALYRAFGVISDIAGKNNFKLEEEAKADWVNSDAIRKLELGVQFAKDLIALIEKMPDVPRPIRWIRDEKEALRRDIYDDIADLIYSLIDGASRVRDKSASWSIQHNSVFTQFFGIGTGESQVWRIVQFKVRRLIFDELNRSYFSYLTSRIFGMMINVVGFRPWAGESKSEVALRQMLVYWARGNLMNVARRNVEIVEWGLPSNLKLDTQLRRLVRTYPKGLERRPKIVYLQLD